MWALSSHRFTRRSLPSEPVLFPALLLVGHDTALCMLSQQPAVRDLDLSGDVSAEKMCVAHLFVRQRNRQERRARFHQVVYKGNRIDIALFGERRYCDVAFRKALHIRG